MRQSERQQRMSEQDNVKIVHKFYDNFNAHNLEANDRLQSEDAKTEAPGAPGPMNVEQGRGYTQVFLTAFPDLHFDILQTIAQGDHVVVNWRGTGTHNGPLMSPSGHATPATHKAATVHGSNTFEVKNGKITRSAVYFDMAGLLTQLGLMPPM